MMSNLGMEKEFRPGSLGYESVIQEPSKIEVHVINYMLMRHALKH